MDKIELIGMKFFGYHGCMPEERKVGQTFFVEAELFLSLARSGIYDDISATVDYAKVFSDVREVVEGEPVKLIETVAERIAARLMKEYPRIESVRISVAKSVPRIFMNDGAFARVTIERSREEYE